MTDRKPPVDAAVDLLFYAPLGLALEARTLLPRFVERGRNQVGMARMVGQFAVRQGQTEVHKRLGPLEETLADFGLIPRAPAPRADEAPAPARPVQPVAPILEAVEPVEVVADAVPVSDLAIPDYDSLAASQVVPRLRGLEADELEAVRAYEAAHRGRKTILNRVAQLQTP